MIAVVVAHPFTPRALSPSFPVCCTCIVPHPGICSHSFGSIYCDYNAWRCYFSAAIVRCSCVFSLSTCNHLCPGFFHVFKWLISRVNMILLFSKKNHNFSLSKAFAAMTRESLCVLYWPKPRARKFLVYHNRRRSSGSFVRTVLHLTITCRKVFSCHFLHAHNCANVASCKWVCVCVQMTRCKLQSCQNKSHQGVCTV